MDSIFEDMMDLLSRDIPGLKWDALIELPIGARYILLAEACNWAAKVISSSYYDRKPALVVLASRQWGVRTWLDTDPRGNVVYYLYHKEVGVASFHDPYGEVSSLNPEISEGWQFPWSGIRRQDQAFELLGDLDLVKEIAVLTRPRRLT